MPVYVWECTQGCGEIEVYRPLADYKVPPEHEHPVQRILSACMGIPDIKPYLATAGDRAGQPIGSRREHREFLKRNRLVELGDVKPKSQPFRKVANRRELKEDLLKSIHQVNALHPRG